MALSKHFEPVEHFGFKFDRGMILYEFDAFREPEKTRFPQIGDWLGRGNFNEIPTPQMLWRGRLWPDLYIANQLDSLINTDFGRDGFDTFNAEFIYPMCKKISGKSYSEIEEKYHRAIWLPKYWPETLRERKSLRTPFYYPRAGYAGAMANGRSVDPSSERKRNEDVSVAVPENTEINLAFITAKPREGFSVLFVVDESPIYRVTDMDICAGIETAFHRWVVEFRGACGVMSELLRLGLAMDFRTCAFGSVKLSLPTIENVKKGWKPKPHMNDMLWEEMNCSLTT